MEKPFEENLISKTFSGDYDVILENAVTALQEICWQVPQIFF